MKCKYILPVIALAGMFFASCDDTKMEWYKDPSHGEVTESELPLQLAEKISRYEALRTYADFTLGVGVGLDLYMNDETYRQIVEENFDEVTIGYAMKHGPMVGSDGSLRFGPVDELIARLQSVGLGLYGHTLVWHTNQNASYLNALIAPEIIPGPAGESVLDVSGLEDGSFTGWNPQNPGAGITVVDGQGMVAGTKAVELISGAASSQPYALQLITPEITVVPGHTYEVSFYVRSEQPGRGRISFVGLANNYPWVDWDGSGTSEYFDTSAAWKQITFTLGDLAEGGTSFQMAFDLGYLPDVTYYIDIENMTVIDLDAGPTVVNLVANGTFDTDLTGWAKYNGAADAMSQATGADAYQGGGSLKVVNATSGNEWDTQIHADFTEAWTAGANYRVSFMIRSEAAGSMRCSTTGETPRYQGDVTTTTTWTEVVWNLTANGSEIGLNLDMGKTAGTYYIDNVVVQEVTGTRAAIMPLAGPIVIEKTDEEKAEIIGEAMESWISQMVTHCKGIVKAWDVVNEPMDDGRPSSLKTGVGKEQAADEFYWQDYLGMDYAVMAFNLARQYGNPDDKLFINDYNLEYNLAKCDGLIAYVQYIESRGAVVDGIGTQMHIGIDSNRDNIVQMFQKLAATGKLIKISELDIKLNTASPTAEQLAQQADMYQFVIDSFREYIPAAQQFSICIWGVSDNAKEHEYWIPDDGPNVWDANYQRKHAYKGVADGLAGRDVSEEFTGDLQY